MAVAAFVLAAGAPADTSPPAPTLVTPAADSSTGDTTPVFSGVGGHDPGDDLAVTVRVYAGGSATGTAVQTLVATRGPDGSYSIEASPALAEGRYTAQAEQGDDSGNTGLSGANTFVVLSAYRDEVLSDNPRAYWRLGEAAGTTAADEKGVNNGTYLNGVLLSQPSAIWNTMSTSVVFDGVNDFLSVPDSSTLDMTTGVTVEVWVKRTKSGIFQPLIGKPSNGQSKLENYSIWLNSTNKPIAYFGNGTTYVQVTTTTALDTSWHHLAATYDNATAKLYVDGVLRASTTSTVVLTPNADLLTIGRTSSGGYSLGAGLDEAAVYNVPLSATRIKAHYDAGSIDSLPPFVALANPPNGDVTKDTTPAFSGSAGGAAGDSSVVTVNLYAGPSASGTPIQTPTANRQPDGSYSVDASPALGEGLYTARAQQNDAVGNTGFSNSNTFTVDTTAPVATITAQPDDPTDLTTASFSFTANEGGSTFQCSLDGAAFAGCTSPKNYSGLGDGDHTFRVKATDPAGNTGPEDSYDWTVDTSTPTTTITSGPASPTNATTASFTFEANVSGSSFECSLDGVGFTSCTSPKDYSGLTHGAHDFRVKATSPLGATGPEESYPWTVDTDPPSLSLTTPADGSSTNDTTPTHSGVGGTAAGDATTVTIKIYEGSSVGGTPLQTHVAAREPSGAYSISADPLAEGIYTSRAEQGDSAGNVGFSNANTFTVDALGTDNNPPTITLGSPANGSATNDRSPSFSGVAGTEAGDLPAVGVKIYAGSSATGTPVQVLSTVAVAGGAYAVDADPDLADGIYTAQAQQDDVAGNTGFSPANTFTVDGTAPTTTINSGPADPTNATSASFTFTASEGGSSFECSLDGAAFAGCTSPKNYSGLGNGDRNFRVRATDPVGNTGPEASYDWTIDSVAPTTTINSGPSNPTNSTSAAFTFTASEGGSSFECSLDGAAFAGCTSPKNYSGLGNGDRSFRVRATDGVGNTGPHTSYDWTIDTVVPVVSLTLPADGSSTQDTTPTFAGSAGALAGDSTTVTVRVYVGTTATGSPIQTRSATRTGSSWSIEASPSLADGTYTARAEQTDAAGNSGLSAANTFVVDQTPSGTSYSVEVMADAPRSYWRLGETTGTTATDAAGANSGTYTGGVLLNRPGALVGDSDPAVSLDGVNDYVVVPDSSSLDMTTGVSVELWLKRSKSGWQTVLGKPGNGASRFENYAIWINSTNKPIAYFGNGTTYVQVTTSAALDTNWHHVVATYDNATAKLYVDGVLGASQTSTVVMTPNSLPLNIGRTNTGGSFYGGLLDEVAVYPTALSAARVVTHYETGKAIDRVPPNVTLAGPAHGTSTGDTTPTLVGSAGALSTDSATVTVRIYAGKDALGTPVQTLAATRQGDFYTVDASPALAAGTYTAQAEQSDTSGNKGRSSANTFSVSAPAPSTDRVMIAAGDIAQCEEDTGEQATGALLSLFPDAVVAALGDQVYPTGTAQQFTACYEGTGWGAAKNRTRPVFGTHDYGEVEAGSLAGNLNYFSTSLALFGPTATDPSKAYYSYDLGAWHIVALNAACFYYAPNCSETAQEQWLRADLASRPAMCTLAYLHNPLFTSGSVHAGDARMQRYWNVLYEFGADVVLNGHNHQYERFAPQTPTGVADSQYGIREFVVGTGGAEYYSFGTPKPNSERRQSGVWGVIKLTLRPTGYDWEFVPVSGQTFSDTGSGSCHSAPPAP